MDVRGGTSSDHAATFFCLDRVIVVSGDFVLGRF